MFIRLALPSRGPRMPPPISNTNKQVTFSDGICYPRNVILSALLGMGYKSQISD